MRGWWIGSLFLQFLDSTDTWEDDQLAAFFLQFLTLYGYMRGWSIVSLFYSSWHSVDTCENDGLAVFFYNSWHFVHTWEEDGLAGFFCATVPRKNPVTRQKLCRLCSKIRRPILQIHSYSLRWHTTPGPHIIHKTSLLSLFQFHVG